MGPTKSLKFQKIDRKLLPIVQPGDLVVIKSANICYGTQDDFKIMDVGARVRKRKMIVYPAEIFENENFNEKCFDRHASIHGEKQENENTFSTSIDMKLMDSTRKVFQNNIFRSQFSHNDFFKIKEKSFIGIITKMAVLEFGQKIQLV